ncbi:response regulator transcription factor [Oryzomonas rubra]|uniref:Response regulator transcription factor n=1 Tax=Oryzomonas rubra TaxID=2509454 RepID=A0A5A9X5K9_9BACT|nr:response regulator transcription factor [Oryzomonas rubra]KAA0888367.1 response regulator transcription factor [Oryzomonas rubra]
MVRILIIDDDVDFCELMAERLVPEGFELDAAHQGNKGVEMALAGSYDVILLDVMLPEINGFDVLRLIREQSATPVLMLTARGDDIDKIVGLEMGADDYLPKPFNPRELIARIRAILRRVHPLPHPGTKTLSERLAAADIVIDQRRRTASCNGVPLELTPGEFGLLEVLVKRADEVVSRDELSTIVLGRNLNPFDRSIDVHISNLRKKLGPDQQGNDRIRAVRAVGYVLPVSSAGREK